MTIHIISIIGEECNINTLCKVSEMTGGQVERVDPKDLVNNFQVLLNNVIIATNVELKVKLHKGLEFRNENPLFLNEDKTILTRQLGNVNEQTEVTFEYKMKKVKELLKFTDIDMTQITAFPFQTQINYTRLDGSKCVRVITEVVETSSEKEELEKNADMDLLG